jgi:hypothetical protein
MPTVLEWVFVHRPSAALLCCDLVFNIQNTPGAMSPVMLRIMGIYKQFAMGRIFKKLTKDASALAASIEQVLAEPFERIVLAHGGVVEVDAKAELRRAAAWCLQPRK